MSKYLFKIVSKIVFYNTSKIFRNKILCYKSLSDKHRRFVFTYTIIWTHFDKSYKQDTTFPHPDYRSETDVEIAFVKEDVEVSLT